MSRAVRCLVLCIAVLANACGGGSGGTATAEPVAPAAPVEPDTPVEPRTPVEPVTPLEPIAPIAPVLPVAPTPVNPVAPGEPGQPAKVFALMDAGDPASVLDAFARRDTVDGLAFRTAWRILEPAAGSYDWTTLDAALDTVRARGKLLTLHVGASSVGTPAWLGALGAVMYTYSTPMAGTATDAVPWDAIFLSRYTRFVAALAAHVQARGDTGLIHAVSDGVPVAEMSIVGCRNSALTGGIAYSRPDYLNAWKTTLDAHAAAFPATRLLVSAPIAVICMPDNDGQAFYTEVMNYALAKNANAAIFAADLNAAGSMRLLQVDASIRARATVAYQMIWSSTNDPQNRLQGTLDAAVCQGIASGAGYFEIYKVDISSTEAAIQDAVRRARAGHPCSAP